VRVGNERKNINPDPDQLRQEIDRRSVNAVMLVACQHPLHRHAQSAPHDPRNEYENDCVEGCARKGVRIAKLSAFDSVPDAHDRIDLINWLKIPAH